MTVLSILTGTGSSLPGTRDTLSIPRFIVTRSISNAIPADIAAKIFSILNFPIRGDVILILPREVWARKVTPLKELSQCVAVTAALPEILKSIYFDCNSPSNL